MNVMSAAPAAAETDVLIVGAGPVGMTLALTLRKFGASVTIVDREKTTTTTPRAAVVWPRTMEVLSLLDIAPKWQAEAVALNGFTFVIDGNLGTLDIEGLQSPFPHPLGISQDRTEIFLDEALRQSGADYRRGVEVTEMELGDTARATLQAGDQTSFVTARWIVGCEGARSIVRKTAGIDFVGGRNEGVQLVQGDVRVRGSLAMEPQHGYLWSQRSDHAALFCVPTHRDGHYRVLVTLPDDGAQGDPDLADLQQQVRCFIPDAVLSDPLWLNRYRVQHRLADTYRRGCAFIVGDAAHTWVPIGGQGMNIGMQDAFNLGWKLGSLVRGDLTEAALDTFEAERRPLAAQNIEDTQRLYHALLSPRTLSDGALRRLIPHLLGLGAVSHRVMERFAEIDFHHAPNALIAPSGGGTGCGSGERAPDAWVARPATGETLRLFDLYRTGKWHVFGWVMQPEDAASVEAALSTVPPFAVPHLIDATSEGIGSRAVPVLRDMTRRAADAWGVTRSGIHVVRPDGVIAYRGAAKQNVTDILAGWLSPPERAE